MLNYYVIAPCKCSRLHNGMGVANAPIPGWDFLLPMGIFSGISISTFPGMLPLHSASSFCFACMQ